MKRGCYRFALRHAYRDLLEEEFSGRVVRSVGRELGSFLDGRAFAHLSVTGRSSESGVLLGELVHAMKALAKPSDTMLLPGERRSARDAYSRITGVPQERILTAGIDEDMDFRWDFEHAPPSDIPHVEVVASQAILEHLVDPYRHLRDCFSLLVSGGHLIFHTVMPGFQYHRYPVDCMRFYPDWFEVAAERLGAQVVLRSMSSEAHVVYGLRRP